MIPYVLDSNYGTEMAVDKNGAKATDINGLLSRSFGEPAILVQRAEYDMIRALPDAISCETTWEINGQCDLTMEYPVSGHNYDLLKEGAYIVAPVCRSATGSWSGAEDQPFRIRKITTPLDGVVTVYAVHLLYLLDGIVVKPFHANSNIEAVDNIFSDSAMTYVPVSVTFPQAKTGEMLVDHPTTAWDLMSGRDGCYLDVYGGEWRFDWWMLSSVDRLGSNTGITINYGVNLVDFEQDLDMSDCYTGVICYAEKDDQIVYGEIAQAPGNHLQPRILSIDASDRFDGLPSVQQLTAEARRYAISNKVNEPRLSWTVDFVPLDQTEEYKNVLDEVEKLDIGDTVNVHVDKLGIDIEARVKTIHWNVLLERYNSVTIGNARRGIADTIVDIARKVDS